jgi:predicted dehydrogenase
MSQETLRIAVAGAGAFGREHLAALARRDDVRIAGVADIRPDATDAAIRDFGAERDFVDAVAMIEAIQPDGLVVASPGQTHLGITTAALARGIPVLLEKPVGLSAADADVLIAAEKRSTAFVLPGHILRFAAPYRQVVDIVRSGEIGTVLSVTARNHRDESHAVRYPDIDPVLMTMVHDIDFALWVTGGTIEGALALRRPAGTSRSETLVTAWDDSGAMWHISNAWTLPVLEGAPDRVEVVGDHGSVEMDLGIAIRVFGTNAREIDLRAAPPDDMLATELDAFLSGVRQARHPGVVTLADAKRGLVAADAIIRSLATGKIVEP